MQISLSFQMPIRNYSEKQIDNHKEIYAKYLAHPEQIHSARDIYPIIFFVVDLIRFM